MLSWVRENPGWALIYLGIAALSAPITIFFARWWWEATVYLLTAPWSEILCLGEACQ